MESGFFASFGKEIHIQLDNQLLLPLIAFDNKQGPPVRYH